MNSLIVLISSIAYLCSSILAVGGPTNEISYNIADNSMIRKHNGILFSELQGNRPLLVEAKRRSDASQISDEIISPAATDGFYPSFLRNSRHYLQFSEEVGAKSTAMRAKLSEQSSLGSGDFGVLRGGTFYPDREQPVKKYDFYGLSANSHNGHQRPFAATLHYPTDSSQSKHYPTDSSDPFSNFRDFADINITNDGGQYSVFHAVFENKEENTAMQSNGTIRGVFPIIKSKTDIDLWQSQKKMRKRNYVLNASRNAASGNDIMVALS